MKILLLRHASPDWNRTDIPYDIPPGPPLSPQGENEASALAEFLNTQAVVKLYYSPFERSTRTAQIIAAMNGIACTDDKRLSEWRARNETESQVRKRMVSIFKLAVRESNEIGPIGLVSHGGPVSLLLQELGIDPDYLASYKKLFDGPNPLPPAGAWIAERASGKDTWNFRLEFTPPIVL